MDPLRESKSFEATRRLTSPTRALRINPALAAALAFAALLAPCSALASDGHIDGADTAWILISTALVLFMTIPGLSLFYGGLVQTKNVLSVLMQCLALTAAITLLWLAFGYSLAFDTTGMVAGQTGLHAFVGGLSRAFLTGVDASTPWGTIPEILFFAFQMTFAIITPGLIVGAFAERMKFSAMMVFSLVWLVVVYLPICHMTWGGEGGYFADLGVLDFAGGIVVHITAGIAALVACIVIGPRTDYRQDTDVPAQHDDDGHGRRHAVGRVVRLQRGQRPRERTARRPWPSR